MTPSDPFALWAVDDQPQLVRAAANEVYLCQRGGQAIYVRITFDDHRSRDEIVAEMQWMRRLAEAGARVVLGRSASGGFELCVEQGSGW